jgi:Sec1 family
LENRDEFNINEIKSTKKIIIFFLGGITPAEIRAINALKDEYKSKDLTVIAGSTHLLTP